MAKICILVTVAEWSEFRLFFRQAPALADDGHQVIYMASDPGTKVTDKFQFYTLSRRRRKITRLTGSLNLLIDILKVAPDVLEVVCVEQLPLALALKLFTRIKVVYDCREDMYHSIRDHKDWSGVWLRKLVALCVRFVEYLAARTLDGMVVSDQAIYDIHHTMPDSRKVIFYNTPTLSLFTRNYAPLSQRRYDVVLMGSMSQRTGVLTLIEAAGLLKETGRQITVLLLGQPSNSVMPDLKSRMIKYGIQQQVTITGQIPHEEVPAVLSTAKIGFVGLLDMPKFRNNIACKAFEYMACGMPVVSSDLPPERLFIREPETGIFLKPGDADALAKAIAFLLDNIQHAQAMGEAGRKDVELKWNCENDQKKLREFYRRILTDKRRGRQR